MSGGNVKILTALGEALVEGFSDVGSIQSRSRPMKRFIGENLALSVKA